MYRRASPCDDRKSALGLTGWATLVRVLGHGTQARHLSSWSQTTARLGAEERGSTSGNLLYVPLQARERESRTLGCDSPTSRSLLRRSPHRHAFRRRTTAPGCPQDLRGSSRGGDRVAPEEIWPLIRSYSPSSRTSPLSTGCSTRVHRFQQTAETEHFRWSS